jgi:putative flippase GtrA
MAYGLLLLGPVKNARELLTAGMAGIVGTGIDVSALVLMVGSGVSIPVATFVAALLGAATIFVLNKYVAFRDRSPINVPQLARFGFVAVSAAMLMAVAMKIVAVKLAVPVVVAKLACAAIVFAIWTYPAQRRLVFARPALA